MNDISRNVQEISKAIINNINSKLRNIFSGTIKESFLIDVLSKIRHDPRYHSVISEELEDLKNGNASIKGGLSKDIEICKMIVMIHYSNVYMLEDDERGRKQNSDSYKQELINEVYKAYAIKGLATLDYANNSLESYLPIIYYVSALNNYCGELSQTLEKELDDKDFKNNVNITMLYKIVLKVKACINLANLMALDELIIIYRSLIELFMTYCAIWDQDEDAIEMFYKLDQATFDFNNKGIRNEELKKEAGKLNYVKYINYGWLEHIDEFQKLPKKYKTIDINGLAHLLDVKCGDYIKDFGTILHKYYKACNSQTHGTIIFMNDFEEENYIFQNIALMLRYICIVILPSFIECDYTVGDVNLLDELEKVLKTTHDSYKAYLFNNTTVLNKTNNDYRNRAISCFKLK